MADDPITHATIALHDLDCRPDCGDSLTTMSAYARQAQAVLAAMNLEARDREHYRAGRTAASRALAADLAEAMNHTADPVARAAYQHAAALADRLAEAGREELDRLLDQARRDTARAIEHGIIAELVCCHVYDEHAEAETYDERAHGHAICYWGAAAAHLAADEARRHGAGQGEEGAR